MNNLPNKSAYTFFPLVLWWLIFAILFLSGNNQFELLNIIGFSFMIFVPGFLTLTAAKIRYQDVWSFLTAAVGLSIFELIFVALIGNYVLPFIGIVHTLSSQIVFTEMSLFVAVIYFMCINGHNARTQYQQPSFRFASVKDACFAFVPAIFVVLSVLGTIRLNNGQDGFFTFLMLISMGAYAAFLMYKARKRGDMDPLVFPTAIYFMSLSLLLMTSLRGSYTTGHDIQTEFYVFELARQHGAWLIDSFRNAYNACMSITILPAAFAALFKFSDPYIYKILFQIIFAFVPPVVYTIVRRYVSMEMAFLAAFYFISFPTFFSDMPMLNRQEIAFLFWVIW